MRTWELVFCFLSFFRGRDEDGGKTVGRKVKQTIRVRYTDGKIVIRLLSLSVLEEMLHIPRFPPSYLRTTSGRSRCIRDQSRIEFAELSLEVRHTMSPFATAHRPCAKQVLLGDPDNGPCRDEHRRCRAVVKQLEAGAKLLEAGEVEGAERNWRAATALEPDNPLFVGPLLLKVSMQS